MNDVLHNNLIELLFYKNETAWNNMYDKTVNIIDYIGQIPVDCNSVAKKSDSLTPLFQLI